MAYSSRNTASALPQGFSIYQPKLGAQLQFLPAIGTPELDELINAYVAGAGTTQEKRASVSLDFLEYSHVTGQSFKFYHVYSMTSTVESPATDSGYGSSFNASPATSNWDFSQISTSRSPPSQQVRTSPKVASSRQQATDFSSIPGMKIMTRDGRDVTNSASRGSKTKEQRDHAHLMRIIKACDSCRRKKIRCDPSHKKRVAAQSQPQPAAKSAKKAKAVVEAVQAAAVAFPASVPVQAPDMVVDQSVPPIDLEGFTSSLSTATWEEFIDYSPADVSEEYDFFNDPAGYFSPESASSSVSAYSTKPVTPTSQQEISAPYGLPGGNSVASPHLPFDQTEPTSTYVDFNLFSPVSNFSEDEHMVPVDLSAYLSHHPGPLQSDLDRSDQQSGSWDFGGTPFGSVGSVDSEVLSWYAVSRLSGEDNSGAESGTDSKPGASDGGRDYYSPSSIVSDELAQYSSATGSVAELFGSSLSSGAAEHVLTPGSVSSDMGQSSVRRGLAATATVIANTETSTDTIGEAKQCTTVNTGDTTSTSPSVAVHRLKTIRSLDSSAEQHSSRGAIIAPRTETLSEEDVSRHVATTTETLSEEDASRHVAIATTTETRNAVTTVIATTAERSANQRDEYHAEAEASLTPTVPLPQPSYHAPCAPETGSTSSLMPLIIVGEAIASVAITSTFEQSISRLILLLFTLATMGAWLQRLSRQCRQREVMTNMVCDSHAGAGQKGSLQSAKNGGMFQVHGANIRSQLSLSTLSVHRELTSRSPLVVL